MQPAITPKDHTSAFVIQDMKEMGGIAMVNVKVLLEIQRKEKNIPISDINLRTYAISFCSCCDL